jgi:hypothetical protein
MMENAKNDYKSGTTVFTGGTGGLIFTHKTGEEPMVLLFV